MVVHNRSEPIGKEKIILELTALDLKTFEKQKELKEILTKEQYKNECFKVGGK